jgi:hypothetical protein
VNETKACRANEESLDLDHIGSLGILPMDAKIPNDDEISDRLVDIDEDGVKTTSREIQSI